MAHKRFLVAILLTAALLAAAGGAVVAQDDDDEGAAANPVLADLNQRVAMTVPQTTLGRLVEFLARDSGVNIMVDQRYASTPVSLLGAEGELGEVLGAIEAGTGMTFRKIDDIYFLARSQEGVATIAHRERRQRYARLVTTQNELTTAALRVLQPIVDRLGLSDRARVQIMNLTIEQQDLLYRQGYLTIGQLFPRTTTPMFDVLRQAMSESGAPETSVADFAQRRVYFNPGLVFQLFVPLEERPEPYLWSVDLFGLPAP